MFFRFIIIMYARMISIKVHNFFYVGFLVLLIFESKANAFFYLGECYELFYVMESDVLFNFNTNPRS